MNLPLIRCLIVDDEPQAHEVLKSYIKRVPSLRWVGSCFNALDAISFLREQSVDLILLDIQMPELLGTDLVKTLQNPPRIILVTAHREFAVEGFELDAVDYLLKPVSLERFLKAVNKAAPSGNSYPTGIHNQNEKYLYFRANRKMEKVWLRDLLYAESLKDYVRLFTKQGSLITKTSMSGMVDMLPEGDFLQVHRSFLVAVGHIDAYSGESVRIGKAEIPVGPLYRNALRSKMQELKLP